MKVEGEITKIKEKRNDFGKEFRVMELGNKEFFVMNPEMIDDFKEGDKVVAKVVGMEYPTVDYIRFIGEVD